METRQGTRSRESSAASASFRGPLLSGPNSTVTVESSMNMSRSDALAQLLPLPPQLWQWNEILLAICRLNHVCVQPSIIHTVTETSLNKCVVSTQLYARNYFSGETVNKRL